MSNIIRLAAGDNVGAEVIKGLEAALEAARSGDFAGLSVMLLDRDGSAVLHGVCDNDLLMSGMLFSQATYHATRGYD